MLRKKVISYILAAFFIFTFSSILITSFSNDKENRTQKAFIKFTDSAFKSELSASAFNLHFYLKNPIVYGITDAPEIINSINYQDMKNSETYYLDMINSLKKFDYEKLALESQQTYDIFLHYLSTELAFSDLCLLYEPLSPTVGIQAQLPVLLSQYTFNDEADVCTYLKLLHNLPTFFQEILEFEQIKSKNNTFMSIRTAEAIIAQCTDFAEAENNFLIETFEERISSLPQLNSKQKKKYIEENKITLHSHVIPAYKKLASGLSKLKSTSKNQLGLCHYDNGKNYYQYLVSSYTGSERTVLDIEKMIENQLQSDTRILTALSKDKDVYDKMVKNTPDNRHTPKEILEELINHTEDNFPSVKSKKFTINYVPETLENHLSPAFYLSPPIDDPHNNRIFINNSEDFKGTDLYATLAHEGYPGHLYQTTYFNSKKPDLIRHLLNFGGYTEGWATYVELYSYTFKNDNPRIAKAYQASSSYSLALYCLADIGINYHGWDFDTTNDFFISKGIDDKEIVQEIFDSMIAEPANYLQYYVGYLEILELKSKMKSILGDSYTDLIFHTYILDMGPAPFEVIEKYMGTFLDSLDD